MENLNEVGIDQTATWVYVTNTQRYQTIAVDYPNQTITVDYPMTKTEIYIMGYPVQIAYTIHHPDYVEWKLVASKTWEGEHDLLNVLLRVHYHQYIEAAIREHAFMEHYAAAAGYGYDIAVSPDIRIEDMPF